MATFAGIHNGKVVALAECATLPAAKRCSCLRGEKEIVQLPMRSDGWSLASADACLNPHPLTPQARA